MRAGYEVVLFSDHAMYEAEASLHELDPSMYMRHRLFAEHFNWSGLHLCKSLRRLARESERLIVVDVNEKKYCDQHENILLIKEFDKDPSDTELLKVLSILESMYIFIYIYMYRGGGEERMVY